MSVGSVLKRVVTGAPGAALGVRQAVLGQQGLGVYEPDAAPAPAEAAPSAAPAPEIGFKLPELDPNDPDIEEKTAIHRAYEQLAAQLQSDPDIDYKAKYNELAEYAKSRPEPRRWNPFSSFAIAMGSPGVGAGKVLSDNEKADKTMQDREDYLLGLKEQALKGEIAQLAQKGNFKKMLSQTALLEELAATQKRITEARAHKNKLAEIEETNKGRVAVAGIKASSARDVAQKRVDGLVNTYKLNADVRKSMLNLASRMLTGFQTQKDAAGEPIYTDSQVQDMMDILVDYAEEHSPMFQETPTGVKPAPGTTPPKAAPATEGAPAGPGPNPDAAAAFAKRRAARAAAQK